MRTLERLASTPAPISSIISGDILAGFVYGSAISSVLLVVGVAALGTRVVHPTAMAYDILLGAVCFSALGSLLSSPPTDNPSNVMMLSNMVRLPLLFVGGIFVPVEGMPGWGRALAFVSPLTYSCDLARHSLSGEGALPLPWDMVALSAFALAFVVVGIELHKRNIPKRLSSREGI